MPLHWDEIDEEVVVSETCAKSWKECFHIKMSICVQISFEPSSSPKRKNSFMAGTQLFFLSAKHTHHTVYFLSKYCKVIVSSEI